MAGISLNPSQCCCGECNCDAECCCPGKSPESWTVTLAGFGSHGTLECTKCANLNGTWTITRTSGCHWEYSGSGVIIRLDGVGGDLCWNSQFATTGGGGDCNFTDSWYREAADGHIVSCCQSTTYNYTNTGGSCLNGASVTWTPIPNPIDEPCCHCWHCFKVTGCNGVGLKDITIELWNKNATPTLEASCTTGDDGQCCIDLPFHLDHRVWTQKLINKSTSKCYGRYNDVTQDFTTNCAYTETCPSMHTYALPITSGYHCSACCDCPLADTLYLTPGAYGLVTMTYSASPPAGWYGTGNAAFLGDAGSCSCSIATVPVNYFMPAASCTLVIHVTANNACCPAAIAGSCTNTDATTAMAVTTCWRANPSSLSLALAATIVFTATCNAPDILFGHADAAFAITE